MKNIIISAISVLFALSANAQYNFGNDEFEQLYYDLEQAYLDYDYDLILDSEEAAISYIGSRQDTVAANIYSYLGETYYFYLGDRQLGLEHYQKTLEIIDAIETESDLGRKNIIYNIAAIQDELGLYAESESLYQELLDGDREEFGPKSFEYLETALAFGVHYKNTSQYQKAIDLYKKSMRPLKKDDEMSPAFLSELGANYLYQGNYRLAEQNLTNALQNYEEQGVYASTENVATLVTYALLYRQLGKYPEALEVLNEAQSILERLSEENEEVFATVYNNVADVNHRLGNYTQALDIYNQVKDLDAEIYGTEDPTYALTLNNIANIYIELGEYEKATELYQQTSEIFVEFFGESSLDYAITVNQLAFINRKTGNYTEALAQQQKVLQVYEEIFGNEHPEYAHVMLNLADVYANMQQLDEAEPLYQTSINVRKKALGEDHPLYARAIKKYAILKWAKKDLEEAEELFIETFDNYFKQIEAYFPILSEEEKAKFYSNRLKPAFEQFNSFAFEGSRESKHLNGLMYDYQLATKGLIMYATNKVREAILSSGDSVLINKYSQWINYKEQLSQLYSTLELELDERNRRIDSLTTIASSLEKELSASSNAFANTYTSKKITWKDVQAKLNPGEAAVEVLRFRNFRPDSAGYYTNEAWYAALIVRHDTEDYPELVLFRNGSELEGRFLTYYRNAIKFNIEDEYAYNLYWRPISNRLNGIDKVYFSPDGVFNQISIYTLRNPRNGQYSIDELEIQVMTNTKDLIAYADNPNSFPGDKKAVLFGYPNYNKGSYQQEYLASQAATNGDEERSASRSTRGTRGTRGLRGGISRGLRGNLQRYISSNDLLALLPGTRTEVELISQQYSQNASDPEVYLEDQAIETNLKNVQSPHTLHIATHGFFLDDSEEDAEIAALADDNYVQNPLLKSGLIFAGANSFLSSGQFLDKEDEGQDGILTAFEAMNMNLEGTELVVMSACETGLGEVTNGEGVYGLQRSFQIAGAKSIIMSMWTVDDDATQKLMTYFYDDWLKTGNKPAAFINAQKKLREEYPQPYYWGAFVMVGQ
ncbi:MAG: CHAT domain-containing tetratricopeptide repeat protein [Cyclobacteriaceae bacterium]